MVSIIFPSSRKLTAMKYFKLATVIIGSFLLVLLTIITASKGTFFALFVMLILYTVIVLGLEKITYSFVAPTKPALFGTNDHFEEICKKTARLFDRAERYINIVSGRLKGTVYNKDAVKNALKRAIEERKVKVEIIIEEEIDPITKNLIIDWVKTGKIKLYSLSEYNISRHFIVIDDIDVRVEEKHAPDPETFKAYYWYSYKRLGHQAKKKFEEIKALTNPIILN